MSLSRSHPISFVITANATRARAFYEQRLGLAWQFHDGFADVFEINGATLRLTEVPNHQPGPHPILGWRVSDIRSMVNDLSSRGITFIIYPGMGQDEVGIWTAPGGTAKVAFFADPDGNLLSLTEVSES
jgi:catechol 2,3-dioxygenase-like lactoylglutathione lyase family enzyme